ncbi:alpha-aminoadipate reductase Lys1p [Thecamonas trahens ATCC 50062]|uniref:Alpha-aminoadipate reductase Lys1p n=1 Tax=Thecamonas trahens ATCC 50062 TaxID=461836 RepID=A0A0L0DI65_THETB|nr:alpha-aminoadipate reductase Lys1p [Thecamonas trahens ATCC 50062]KNC50998.1 alpha-aminoadipate reductase Lys1p [Thecamonas trahens ATCC 50062]|eukprot:XP_013756467.1 alpha-aminoadipate reductase Lys1p [Thecamonas trahens ATCC 50062]
MNGTPADVVLSLAEPTCNALLRISLDTAVKPFHIVLTALAILLRKFTGDDDIVLGSSHDTNPLVLRLDLAPDNAPLTVAQLLTRIKDADDTARAHPIPFDELVDALRHRDDSLDSLFSIRFFNACEVSEQTEAAARAEWTIYIEHEPDTRRLLPLRLRIRYDSLLYTRARMVNALHQIDAIITAMAANLDGDLVDISPLTLRARAVLPDPTRPLSDTFVGPIVDFLARHAAATPDRPLLVEYPVVNDDTAAGALDPVTYTYAAIDAAANRVASALVAAGIVYGDVVALYAHRSSALVTAIFGILKAGAIFTVIDPSYPTARQRLYLEVAQPRAIITLSRAGPLAPDVVDFIDNELALKLIINALTPLADIPQLADADTDSPSVAIHADTFATLSFTSGSTGIPKGVLGRHVSLTHFTPWMAETFGLSASDRFTMLSGIAHDPIQRDVFTPVVLGASIHIPDSAHILTPGALAQWLADSASTVTHLTPAMGQLVTANAVLGPGVHLALSTAFFVGDVLTQRDVLRLQALCSEHFVTVNMYGTTETQRAVSYLAIDACPNNMALRKHVLGAGKGMCDVDLLVLVQDSAATWRLAAIGELGELFVRSPHLAYGYLGRDDETAKKFLANPFVDQLALARQPGDVAPLLRDRMYRTGDLGRFAADGSVECVGRADDQVKIRGFRIELKEIDAVLASHDCVRECITLVQRDSAEEKVLVAYFVPQVPDVYDIADIRVLLRSKLPSYSVPSVFMPLQSFPLTPNGKLHRAMLPAPDLTFALDTRAHHLSARESLVVSLFSDVLARPVGPETDFWDAGGHSLSATELTFRLRRELRTDIPLNALYQHPTPRALAAAVEAHMDASAVLLPQDQAAASPDAASSRAADLASQPPPELELEVEAALDPTLDATGRAWHAPSADDVAHVLLTGATGFVGAYLLAALLVRRPNATIHCLVRGSSVADATSRLHARLAAVGLGAIAADPATAARVDVILGDLTAPWLGIAPELRATLTTELDEIYHCGALVHWVYPYEQLRAANVASVQECLRFAVTGPRVITLHFVSSTSVFDSGPYAQRTASVAEDDPLEHFDQLSVGYGQSKFVAETMLRTAATRNIPVLIHRPAYVLGDSTAGATNVDDYLIRMVKGCVELGAAPIMKNRVYVAPVDFVAEAMVRVAEAGPDARGHAYHFLSPDVFRMESMFDALAALGYPLERLDYVEWRDRLEARVVDGGHSESSTALYPLLHFVLDDLPTKSMSPDLCMDNVPAMLGDSFTCTPMSRCFYRYIAFLVTVGYLDPPPNADTARVALPVVDVAAGANVLQMRTSSVAAASSAPSS